MSQPKQPPTLLLCPGSWHTPTSLTHLQTALKRAGYPTQTIAHPTNGADPPTKTLTDDTTNLRQTLSRLIDQEGKGVVLIAHSYGGLVTSNAAEGLGRQERANQSLQGGIVLLIYMTAFLVPRGESLFGVLGEYRPANMVLEGSYCRATSARESFYHDLSPDMLVEAEAQLTHSCIGAYTESVNYEPWRDIPCAYIFCEEDRALGLPVQEMLVDMMRSSAPFPVRTGRLRASHSPFYSIPLETAEVIVGFVREVEGV
ncbi:Alpha/beta hydrolase fold-1 [Aspergillus pseudonomiae]|uniref:Alpha/beta hydrolase fold-1 n=1 Tax=Aspergillus pseudonomiae TaxID=1506151 RepID=A0A5N6HMF6_9EURO|nr:Alpha/beta hydrolase fold-1 [Aspergillus pseudonomiae]KAB8255671.1 Alpha/beta hydrolase fold-1 [Aspergillus pseudonomiae]KAE8406409.1 Alpha/beta hydrolase fold-1 [Aspergillus pseudonomiae]